MWQFRIIFFMFHVFIRICFPYTECVLITYLSVIRWEQLVSQSWAPPPHDIRGCMRVFISARCYSQIGVGHFLCVNTVVLLCVCMWVCVQLHHNLCKQTWLNDETSATTTKKVKTFSTKSFMSAFSAINSETEYNVIKQQQLSSTDIEREKEQIEPVRD